MLSSVLFPDPDGPIRATNSPGRTSRLTPRTASTTSPGMRYCLVRARASRIGWAVPGAARSAGAAGATDGSDVMRLGTPVQGGWSVP